MTHAQPPAASARGGGEVFEKVATGVLDSLVEGCQVVDFDWRYVYVNDSVAQHGGTTTEALLGRTMMECYPGIENTEMFSVLERCMTERTHDRMENEFTRPDGSVGCFELRFVPVPAGVCVLSLDRTEAKHARRLLERTEDQVRHLEKMDAIGLLAGGVAHDFNNILSVILSYGELLLLDLKKGEPMRADVEEITRAAKRATDLTRQLLTFSRQQVFEPRVLDLNEILAGMDRMLHRILGADVDLVSIFARPLGRVRGDPGNIEQVIMNLVVNARDAMPRGGKLTLETGNVVLDEGYAREHLGVTPGPHVMIAVTDNGQGIDKATMAHIFEPFFTTKPMGKGTGLGLSTVFGIVQQSGGSVWVYSEPGQGTTFKVYLPRVDAEVDEVRAVVEPSDLRGSETILLVEDDDQVRVVVREILRRYGYHVVECRTPAEALLVAEQEAGVIHLLLTDVVMPQMSGPDLAKRLAVVRPSMRVLFMSGYTDDSVVRHGVLDAAFAYLQKPITPDIVATKVRALLDGHDTEPSAS